MSFQYLWENKIDQPIGIRILLTTITGLLLPCLFVKVQFLHNPISFEVLLN